MSKEDHVEQFFDKHWLKPHEVKEFRKFVKNHPQHSKTLSPLLEQMSDSDVLEGRFPKPPFKFYTNKSEFRHTQLFNRQKALLSAVKDFRESQGIRAKITEDKISKYLIRITKAQTSNWIKDVELKDPLTQIVPPKHK